MKKKIIRAFVVILLSIAFIAPDSNFIFGNSIDGTPQFTKTELNSLIETSPVKNIYTIETGGDSEVNTNLDEGDVKLGFYLTVVPNLKTVLHTVRVEEVNDNDLITAECGLIIATFDSYKGAGQKNEPEHVEGLDVEVGEAIYHTYKIDKTKFITFSARCTLYEWERGFKFKRLVKKIPFLKVLSVLPDDSAAILHKDWILVNKKGELYPEIKNDHNNQQVPWIDSVLWGKVSSSTLKDMRKKYNVERYKYRTAYMLVNEQFYGPLPSPGWRGIKYNKDAWEIHHIRPLEFGGSNAFDNFIPLRSKDHQKFTTWFRNY